MSTYSLADRLKEAIRKKGYNASELAKKADLRPSFIYDILNGKSQNPSTSKMAHICQLLGTDLSYLMGLEQNEMAPMAENSDYLRIHSKLVVQNRDGEKPELQEQQSDPYYFRRSWVEDKLQSKAEHLRIVKVEGDAMEPSLYHDDIILIDVSKQLPSPPGIFVLFDGMGLIVKRLEVAPSAEGEPHVRILSDNPQYQAYERSLADANMIGRVVWFAREMR
jgi:transcriptional regulator with XRE-family HTH domain